MFESMQNLKASIEVIDILDDDRIVFISGKSMRAIHGKKIILLEIEDFKGFDCNGFFILGKPLLTSILANFVTYLIILIQFKITETTL